MALIRVFQVIDNDVWKVTFNNDPVELSEDDKKRMKKFGEPEIDLGGTFLGTTDNEFVLPSKKAKIRADFPYTAEFDSRDSQFAEDTETKVVAYRTEILSRITTAFTTLRAQTDTFTGELTYNL